MLYLKTTVKTVAPSIYGVDIAAKPPGKTFSIYMAVDADNLPQTFLDAIEGLGFKRTTASPYTHNDGKKILDLHYQKGGSEIFEGWSTTERDANLTAIEGVLTSFGISVTPRVMSLAEAF
jgi:hypothetical protein